MTTTVTTGAVVYKDGTKALVVPKADARGDGTIWAGGSPLLNGGVLDALGITAQIKAAIARKDFGPIPPEAYMRYGDNPYGRRVITMAQERTATRTANDQYLADHPEVAERQTIERLFDGAERAINATDDDNVMRHHRLLGDAKARLAAWRLKYPEAAKEERRRYLIGQAEHQEHLAHGAMLYDCDGSLSQQDQERRRDESLAAAGVLRQQAAAL